MSLAFALMAAINGSTGSSATLACGLKGTKPRRRQSAAARFSLLRGGGASPQRHWPEIAGDLHQRGRRRPRPLSGKIRRCGSSDGDDEARWVVAIGRQQEAYTDQPQGGPG